MSLFDSTDEKSRYRLNFCVLSTSCLLTTNLFDLTTLCFPLPMTFIIIVVHSLLSLFTMSALHFSCRWTKVESFSLLRIRGSIDKFSIIKYLTYY